MIFRTYFEFSFSFIKYPKTASISGKSGISGTGTGLKFVPVPMPDRVRAQFFMPNARRVFRAFRVFGQTGNPIPGLGLRQDWSPHKWSPAELVSKTKFYVRKMLNDICETYKV